MGVGGTGRLKLGTGVGGTGRLNPGTGVGGTGKFKLCAPMLNAAVKTSKCATIFMNDYSSIFCLLEYCELQS